MAAIQLEADGKHEKHQAHIGQDSQERTCFDGKQVCTEMARQPAQQRWPEEDTGNDLADHRWLAIAGNHSGKQTAGSDDDR